MKKNLLANCLLALFTILTAASCTKYKIAGTTNLESVDGHMLYLKGFVNDELVNIDSCEVVHGKFSFSGSLDSVQVVTLCIDENPVLPVVLEDGEVQVELNEQRQQCKGTPLNDTLTVFNKRYEELMTRFDDLSHRQSQAIMNGEDMDVVNRQLAEQEQVLVTEEDKMISTFISENFDNCLGPYIFQLATSGYPYPMLTPWIDALMSKATEKFKNSPYIKEYMELAKQNQDIMTGVAEPQQQMPPAPPMPQGQGGKNMPAPPTPNEMAKPME